jgi:NitT/TauT family transport system ATP-binding protein
VTESPAGVAIEVNDVKVTYQGRQGPVEAIKSISVSIKPGEFVSIIGPSGCGKSTLLKTIAGLVSQTGPGGVSVGSVDPTEARKRRLFGFVFQEPVLLAWRTNLLNVCLPLEVANYPRESRAGRGRQLLAEVGLADFADVLPRALSGGMRQRVAIARALAMDPPVLLMDEPFGALDELTRTDMNEDLQRLWLRTRKTIIFVTHSISEAVFLSDRVMVLSSRPSRLLDTVDVELDRPRDTMVRDSVEFLTYTRRIREQLTTTDKRVEA